MRSIREGQLTTNQQIGSLAIPQDSILKFDEVGELSSFRPTQNVLVQNEECRPAKNYEWRFGVELYPASRKLLRCILNHKKEVYGAKIRDSIAVFYENGTFRAGILDREQLIQGIQARSYYSGGGLSSSMEIGPGINQDVEFYPNGKLKNIMLGQNQKIQGKTCRLMDTAFFDQEGKLQKCERILY